MRIKLSGIRKSLRCASVAHLQFRNDSFGLELADLELIADALDIIRPDTEFMRNRAGNLADAFSAILEACEAQS